MGQGWIMGPAGLIFDRCSFKPSWPFKYGSAILPPIPLKNHKEGIIQKSLFSSDEFVNYVASSGIIQETILSICG
jgi:hypothetical protein